MTMVTTFHVLYSGSFLWFVYHTVVFYALLLYCNCSIVIVNLLNRDSSDSINCSVISTFQALFFTTLHYQLQISTPPA